MSKKSRERREKHKGALIRPDDYFFNGDIEMVRFGTNTIITNQRTNSENDQYIKQLSSMYDDIYTEIDKQLEDIRAKICQCDPMSIMLFFKSLNAQSQIHNSSESEYTLDENATLRAQDYVQSVLISLPNYYDPISCLQSDQNKLFNEIHVEFCEIYKKIPLFYMAWGAKILESGEVDKSIVDNLVEAQGAFGVQGNRYQIFELEPIRNLLPPHDCILQELYGITAMEIIDGLDKLRYSLSQGYADSWMDIMNEYNQFCSLIESGIDEDTAMQRASTHMKEITSKVFGADLNDVQAITNWNQAFIDALSCNIGEYETLYDNSAYSGWPIIDLPVVKKPFITICGKSYAFLYYSLFDNIYRNIQRMILSGRNDYVNLWKDKQAAASENMVKDLFEKLLPGAEAYIDNYYPVKTSKKQMNENDVLIIYNNYLFIIEVKAGAFPISAPIIDFNSHVSAYKNLVEKADSQCDRTCNYIESHMPAIFYDHDGNEKLRISKYTTFDEIFTFSVTVENINQFAAKAEKLNIISLTRKTIVISYDDLLAYNAYFDSAVSFIHYLKERKLAMDIPQLLVFDELDHLGLYIHKNKYTMEIKQYNTFHHVHIEGFRQELDRYFNSLYSCPGTVQKPVQAIPIGIQRILDYLAVDPTPEKIRLAHFILDLSSEAKEDFLSQIKYSIKRQKEIGRMIASCAMVECKYALFIKAPNIKPISIDNQKDYVYAMTSRDESKPVMWITLEYDNQGILLYAHGEKCLFADIDDNDKDRIRAFGRKKAIDWVTQYKMSHGTIGRNDLCPCGSGKKYKHCCL